ncbi:MAG: queuine/other tRNA-ribosyltransferase [Chloroflexaceae bacterium]|nr:queuine/other tRNA-ribosyltransferase [Chloroflexaceae bacterium]
MAIHYFIPDWDDRVDPNYDFERDLHTAERNPYRDDQYAHELYDGAPYDGILLSRAVVDASITKRALMRELGSVHRYLRLPHDRNHLVMGDCGAFSYWKQAEPPYQSAEMLEYYQQHGFDIGVSIDHLIFSGFDLSDKQRRWHITMHNAEAFLRLHQQGRYTFIPMGVAQGWNPETYQQAVRRLIQMGYNSIALGGLVRSSNHEILQILHAIQAEITPSLRVHLFGVSRPAQVPLFRQLGVTSFDSASRLRKAWTDGRKNYYIGDTTYTAIRVKYARTVAKAHGLAEAETVCKEQAALRALRDYDQGRVSFETVYEAVLSYAELSGTLPSCIQADYQTTLEEQPWKQCACTICRSIGIEVMIFRGNNRNRRRGFHNTWHLYQQLQAMTDEYRAITHQPMIRQVMMEMDQLVLHDEEL